MKTYRIEAYDTKDVMYQVGEDYRIIHAEDKCQAIKVALSIFKDHHGDAVRARNIYKPLSWKMQRKDERSYCRCMVTYEA